MFIQTETTPNPNTLKFIPGVLVMPSGTVFYTSAKDAESSPLATAIFSISGVAAVFFGRDFITVTKTGDHDWDTLKAPILTAIMDYFVAGKSMAADTKEPAAETEDDSEIAKQIRELIDTRVRPAVAADGGDIIFRGFHDGIVKLELHGSCSGCPSSTVTLKNGIENMLKHYVPEVVSVEAVA